MTKPDHFNDLARYLRDDQQGWDTDAAWSRLNARVRARGSNRKAWLIAAILVIAVGIGVIRSTYNGAPADIAAAPQRYRTNVGERISFHLPDGSSVELAPRSELRVLNFDRVTRTVVLDGQAFFNVAREAKRPFQITTQGTTVQVLGTSFEVKSFAGESVHVAVATGRVQVNNTLVTPGQLAIAVDGEVRVRRANVQELTAWRTGQLVFSNTRFIDVAATLERWHDVDVEITNSTLANARVSAAFANQSIDEIVQVLAETLDARASRDGRRITFQPK